METTVNLRTLSLNLKNDYSSNDQGISNEYPTQGKDHAHSMPKALDLSSSGFRRSKRIAELKKERHNPIICTTIKEM